MSQFRHRPPRRRASPPVNAPGQPIRIADEATHRAWSLLWPDVKDEPAQVDAFTEPKGAARE